MTLSPRESMLALVAAAVILFGATGMWAMRRAEAWKQLRARQAELREGLAADQELVAGREQWAAEYETLRGNLPPFSPETKMEVHWSSVMERAAARHGFRLLSRKAAEETKIGEVYELPIECKEWVGTLDSLVHFLFDLQTEGAMLDVRQLQIRPNQDGTTLRGRFLLYCAYTRGSKMEE